MTRLNQRDRLTLIDEVCERFEGEWLSGHVPLLSDFLTHPSIDRNELLTYLVPIDREYRLRNETRSADETPLDINGSQFRLPDSQAPNTTKFPHSIGGYRLVRVIGQGGMGVVYEAHHISLNRTVALKILTENEDVDREAALRFQRETQTAASLHHTNIVPVFEVGCLNGMSFYAMQLITGVDLKQWRREVEADSPESLFRQVATIGLQVANALQFAHDRGIIHRDIKPANLLIDEAQNVWVTDFGLAKTEDDGLTKTGNVVGTLKYLSPERFSGHCDSRADIYSLGASLYELAAGSSPFSAADPTELAAQILGREPVPLQKLATGIPLDLATIIHRAIRRDPDQRYSTAEEMREDLRRFLEGEPILARRRGVVERFGRFVSRNRGIAAAGSTILLLLISSILLLAWGLTSSWQHERIQTEMVRDGVVGLYFAEMNLASKACESGTGIVRLRELVDHWNEPLETDPRGWEWRFFDAMCKTESHVIQTEYPLLCLDWEPAGDRIVAGGCGELRIWNATTATELARSRFHEGCPRITCIRWNPIGQEIAVASSDGKVRIWDESLEQIVEQIDLPDDQPASLCWHPGEELLAIQSEAGRLFKWERGRDSLEMVSAKVSNTNRCGIAFSPDGRQLAVIGVPEEGSYAVTVWNTESWEVLRVLEQSNWPFGTIDWSPDGQRIAASSFDGSFRVWDTETSEQIAKWANNALAVPALGWQPAGQWIATAGYDRQLHLWSAEDSVSDRSDIVSTDLSGHVDTISELRWSTDGSRLATSSFDGSIRIWGLSELPTRQLATVSGGHIGLQWSPSDAELLSVTGGGQIVWDPDTGKRLHVAPGVDATWSHDQQFSTRRNETALMVLRGDQVEALIPVKPVVNDTTKPLLDWSPTSNRLAHAIAGSSADEAVVQICDFDRGNAVIELPSLYKLECLAWHPGGRFLAVSAKSTLDPMLNAVSIFDTHTIRFVKEIASMPFQIYAIAWSSDGHTLAIGGELTDIVIADFETAEIVTYLKDHTFDVYSIDWDPSGTRLASGGADKTVKIWDVAKAKLAASFQHRHEIMAVAWSHDSSRLASLSTGGRLTIRDARKGRVYSLNRPHSHTDEVASAGQR